MGAIAVAVAFAAVIIVAAGVWIVVHWLGARLLLRALSQGGALRVGPPRR